MRYAGRVVDGGELWAIVRVLNVAVRRLITDLRHAADDTMGNVSWPAPDFGLLWEAAFPTVGTCAVRIGPIDSRR